MKTTSNFITIDFKQSRKYFLIFLCLISSIQLNAQAPAIEWQKTFGGTANETATNCIQTTDNGYLISGYTESNDGDVTGNHGGFNDAWVVKLDNSGTLVWQNALGGPGNDFFIDMKQTTDGGYILIGRSDTNGGDVTGNHGLGDMWVAKLNNIGNLQWQKSLGGSSDDSGGSILQTADGGYIVIGTSESTDGDVSGNHGGKDIWIAKINATGTIQWEKSLGGSGSDAASSIEETTDGGYIIGGESSSSDGDVSVNQGDVDYWVVKINDTGAIQWQKSYGGSSQDTLIAIKQTSDGGFIGVGFTLSNDGDVSGNNGNYDIWVIKLDNAGNLQWQKTLGGSNLDAGWDVIISPNNHYIIVGDSQSNNGDVSGNHGLRDFWMIHLDEVGNVLWQKSMGGSLGENAGGGQLTTDGGYIISGSTASNDGDVSGNHGASDFWVVKLATDPLGIYDNTIQNFSIYPNPASDIIQIKINATIEKIVIYNEQGMQVLSEVNTNKVDVSSLAVGVYIVNVSFQNKTIAHKFIKK
jgi:hypothetical protein